MFHTDSKVRFTTIRGGPRGDRTEQNYRDTKEPGHLRNESAGKLPPKTNLLFDMRPTPDTLARLPRFAVLGALVVAGVLVLLPAAGATPGDKQAKKLHYPVRTL